MQVTEEENASACSSSHNFLKHFGMLPSRNLLIVEFMKIRAY